MRNAKIDASDVLARISVRDMREEIDSSETVEDMASVAELVCFLRWASKPVIVTG
jgi:hypothetical protein